MMIDKYDYVAVDADTPTLSIAVWPIREGPSSIISISMCSSMMMISDEVAVEEPRASDYFDISFISLIIIISSFHISLYWLLPYCELM